MRGSAPALLDGFAKLFVQAHIFASWYKIEYYGQRHRIGGVFFNEVKENEQSEKEEKGAAVQELCGVKTFSDYGIVTHRGELLYYLVTPTNISVLSQMSVETKIWQLMLVLSAIPDIEIQCTDSVQCFDANKAYQRHGQG